MKKDGDEIMQDLSRWALALKSTISERRLDQIAKEYSGRIKVAKLNVDENPLTAAKYSVKSIPTLLLFKNGQLVNTRVGALPKSASLAGVDKKHVVIDTVKKAEDSDDIIIRLYEAYGQRGAVNLTFGHAPKTVSECNLMEEEDQVLEVSGNAVSFYIKPYEIRTFKVKLR